MMARLRRCIDKVVGTGAWCAAGAWTVMVFIKATDPKLKAEYEKHKAFMGALGEKGQALIGGPFKWKEGGGMSVLTVKTVEEVKAVAEEDPAVKSGIYEYAIYPWMPVTVAKDCE